MLHYLETLTGSSVICNGRRDGKCQRLSIRRPVWMIRYWQSTSEAGLAAELSFLRSRHWNSPIGQKRHSASKLDEGTSSQ